MSYISQNSWFLIHFHHHKSYFAIRVHVIKWLKKKGKSFCRLWRHGNLFDRILPREVTVILYYVHSLMKVNKHVSSCWSTTQNDAPGKNKGWNRDEEMNLPKQILSHHQRNLSEEILCHAPGLCQIQFFTGTGICYVRELSQHLDKHGCRGARGSEWSWLLYARGRNIIRCWGLRYRSHWWIRMYHDCSRSSCSCWQETHRTSRQNLLSSDWMWLHRWCRTTAHSKREDQTRSRYAKWRIYLTTYARWISLHSISFSFWNIHLLHSRSHRSNSVTWQACCRH